MKHTVLTYKDEIDYPSFGRKRDSYLWNRAWCYEYYDNKRVSKEGRSWIGAVNEVGIAELKKLGWKIQYAHIEVDGEADE